MKRTEVEPLPSYQVISKWITWLWILTLGFLVTFSAYYFTNNTPSTPQNTPSISPTKQRTQMLILGGAETRTTQPTKTSYPPTPTKITLSPTPTIPTPTPVYGKKIVIGKSVEGRPLEVFQFGNGSIERLIIAGIHGGYEWNTIALADEIIEYVKKHPEVIPQNVTLYVLRSLNPDGEMRSKEIQGRANENGVDINRNFPDHWQAEWPKDGCWNYMPITAGSGPASEPETKAFISFINAHQVDALINYHSAALGIFPGGQPPSTLSLDLAKEIASISDYPYPPLDTGCVYTGQLIDWAAEKGIAALDIELTNHRDTDFDQNLSILQKFLAWKTQK